jgi:hypothetical protein
MGGDRVSDSWGDPDEPGTNEAIVVKDLVSSESIKSVKHKVATRVLCRFAISRGQNSIGTCPSFLRCLGLISNPYQ